MAMNQTVQDAFNKLEKDTSVSDKGLDSSEKSALQKLNIKDIQSSKEDLGNQKFKIKNKEYSLKWIVDHYKTTLNSIELKAPTRPGANDGEYFRVDGKTDLAAAIQVYVISQGYSISLNNNGAIMNEVMGIDGVIGQQTKSGIQDYQRDHKIDQKEKVDTYKGEWITIDQLTTTSFTQAFNSLGNGVADKFKDFGMLNKDTGKLVTVQSRNKEKDECTLSYIGRHGVRKTVTVKLGINANTDKLNIKTLAQNIKTAVDNNESADLNEEKRKGIEKGINNYKETSIDDPIIKKYFAKYPHDHSYGGLNKGEVTIKCGNESWNVKKTDITDKNGWFNTGKFADELVKHYKNKAIALEKDNLKASTNRAKGLSDTNVRSNQYRGIIKEIDSYPLTYKQKFMNERNEAVRQLNYETFNNSLINVENEIYNMNLTQDQRIKKLQMVVYAGKENGRRVVDYDNSVTEHFEKVGKKADYLTRTKKLAKYVFGSGNYVEQNG